MTIEFQSTPEPRSSPWGGVQKATEYGPGVWSVSTASHGGFQLSPERNALVADYWRTGDGWYEEDCDWSIVAVTFPDLFTETWVAQARQSLRHWQPDGYEKHFGVTLAPGESHKKDERAFWNRHAADHVVRSAWGDQMAWVPEGFVGVCAAISDRTGQSAGFDERWFLIPEDEYQLRNHGFVVDRARHQEIERPANTFARRPRVAA